VRQAGLLVVRTRVSRQAFKIGVVALGACLFAWSLLAPDAVPREVGAFTLIAALVAYSCIDASHS
jgi:hypothetical protein